MVIAVGGSLFLHALFLSRLGELPLGGMGAVRDAVRLPAVRLQEVRMRSSRPPDEPIRFDPENRAMLENLLSGLAPSPEDLPWDVDLEAGIDPAPPMAPVPLPGPEALTEAWTPAQDILAIKDRLFEDEMALLPRRFMDDLPRIDVAPDISLPREVPSAPPAAGPPSADLPVWIPPAWTGGGGGWIGGHGAEADLPPPRPLEPEWDAFDLAGLADPFEEEAPVAVESLLTLDLATYADPEEGALYFQLQIRRAGEDVLPVLPRDILLLQDSSGSMTPAKLAECRAGLKVWLETLSPRDRFDVMSFSEAPELAFGELVPASRENKLRAIRFIDGMRARGSTDMYRALDKALALPRAIDRPLIVALISDGLPTAGVTGSPEIIDRITRANQGRVSIFSIGAGPRVNRFLLDLLSFGNRGEAIVMPLDEDIDRAMEIWALQLRRPVLTDLRYRFSGVDDRDIYPKSLTHLYLDRPLVVYGRLPSRPGPAAVQIVGSSGGKLHDMVFELDWSKATPGSRDFRETWARQKLYEMISLHIRQPSEASLSEIRSFTARHGLLVPFGFSEIVPR
ncbi:MAG TPA: VWA domain-containing protein [Kiritimatiellia bacterium]|nr:VWA domain-containing protein [Kiritimatiellia bacterium]